MLKRKSIICSLLLFLTAFGSVAFAAAAVTTTPPYASIVAYNSNSKTPNSPNISTIGVLDIINMTPWDISVGPGLATTPMLPGMTTVQWTPFWLAGFHTPNSANTTNFGGSFAYHSYQVALSNLNNAWVLKNSAPNTAQPTYYDTIPIIFNSNSFAQAANTAALNFTATSSAGFAGAASPGAAPYPATAISFGDGTNNYGWESNDTVAGSASPNVTQFLTIEGLQGGKTWKPITNNLGGVVGNPGVGGSTPGANVSSPTYLTVAGLVYPDFSSVAGDNENLDLVVILQSGGHGDMQLLFLAVPTFNDAFLPTAGAIKR